MMEAIEEGGACATWATPRTEGHNRSSVDALRYGGNTSGVQHPQNLYSLDLVRYKQFDFVVGCSAPLVHVKVTKKKNTRDTGVCKYNSWGSRAAFDSGLHDSCSVGGVVVSSLYLFPQSSLRVGVHTNPVRHQVRSKTTRLDAAQDPVSKLHR